MKYVLLFLSLSSLMIILNGQEENKLVLEPLLFEPRNGEAVQAELGTLTVPENRQKKTDKTIQLKFVRFKSTNPNPGAPIVYLAGGPGGSGIGTAKGTRYPLFMALREVADVIAFDQRGTGMSDHPMSYEEYWQYPDFGPLDREKVAEVVTAYTKKAAQFWVDNDVDIAAYNSNESADDLNDLRKALGADKISLWSISYGSHLAMATMRRHEAHLDKIILAGVEGLDHTVKLPSSSQELLERIDALIKEDKKAKKVFPDFLGDVAKLLDMVEETNPIVKTQHPLTKEEIDIQIGRYDLQIILSGFLRGPSIFRSMPFQIRRMLGGDFSALSRWVVYPRGGDHNPMSLAMDIASGISPERRRQIEKEREETLLSDGINYYYFADQAALPSLDLGPEFRAPLVSDLPVLCISGTLDGRTPVSNAEEVLQTLKNGRHLIIEGAGHSDPLFLSDPGILTTMLDFLHGRKIENKTIQLPPVEWYLGDLDKQGRKEERAIKPFKHLVVDGLAVVYIEEIAKGVVKLDVAGMPMKDVIVHQSSDSLYIKTRGQHNGESIKIVLNAADVASIQVRGASELYGRVAISTDQLEVGVHDVGSASLAVDVDRLQVFLDGGDLKLKGRAGDLKVKRSQNSEQGSFNRSQLQEKN